MNTLSYKTVSANTKTANKKWVLIDAENMVLGRLSSVAASMLRGKHKTNFTPHADCGDYVIIINAYKFKLTGNKMAEKEYVRYTGYPGGQRFATPKTVMAKHPVKVVEMAVHGMLPKTKLGNAMKRHLFLYAGSEHPHAAQQPTQIKIEY